MTYSTKIIEAFSKDEKWIASFRYEPYLAKWFAIKPDTTANRVLLLETSLLSDAILSKAEPAISKWQQSCYRAPLKTQIQLNRNCNYQCPVCYATSFKGKDTPDSFTLSELDELLNRLKDNGVLRINLVGGEIFMRKDIEEIFALALSKRLLISCITNARIPGQQIECYAHIFEKLFNVQVSCNGIEKSYEEAYKTDSWASAKKSIVAVLRNSRANILSYVITDHNYQDIPRFLAFAASEAKPKIVKFGSVCWSGRMNNAQAVNYYRNILPTAKCHIEAGRQQFQNLQIQSQLDSGAETPLWEEYSHGYRPFEFYYSPDGRDGLYISSTGDIFPFPLLSDRNTFHLGNTRKDDIQHIWEHHPTLKSIRDVTFKNTDCGKVGCEKVCGLWSASYAYSWSGKLTGKVPCEYTDWQ